MPAIWILAAIALCALLWWALTTGAERHVSKRAANPLFPESLFKVAITETEIISTRPDGTVERCPVSELKEVYIVTTSAGPWSPDVWWVFVGSSPGSNCSFPGGATGEQEALRFARQLPGFDDTALVSAMGSTGNARFLCWQAAA